MRRGLLLIIFLSLCVPAYAVGINRFPFRPFDDVRRPKTADEVKISYQMLVSRQDGIDSTEAKILALYELVEARKELGYDLSKPGILAETAESWQVRIPSKFSINQNRRPPDFIVCVSKIKGKITCFGPKQETH